MKKTSTKIISLLIFALLFAGVISICVASATVDTVGDFTYDFSDTDNTAIVTEYNGTAENVTVPATVSYLGTTYKITEMNDTFKNNTTVKAVTISDGIISIDYYSFLGCTNLTSVTIPDSVAEIGYGAFMDCANLTSIKIPDSVKEIGYGAFGGCVKLTPIIIPDSVTEIGLYAFENCTALTSITIPDSVTSISAGTFKNCKNLTLITIPDSVTKIGYGAFMGCAKLTSIKIPDKITSISGDVFIGCTSLATVTIPEGVTQIGDGAFQDCSSLTSVTIPESVTQIGSSAFWNCFGITSVTIPESVIQIGDGAFHNCMNLTTVTIPQDVTQIGLATFQNCVSLTTVTIPDSVTSIGNRAFYNCEKLTAVTIPDSVTSLGNSTFYNCASLASVTIPESVTQIDDEAFRGCSKLEKVTICCKETKPKLGNDVFSGTPALKNNNIKYVGPFFIPVPQADETEFFYNRSEQTYNIPENENYTVSGNVQTNAGTYTVTVSLKDGYTWEDGETEDKTYTFKISPKFLLSSDFYIPVKEFKYTGSEIRPSVVPALGTFLYTGDFRVNYRDNIYAGTGTIIITGVNNYAGVVEHTFEIVNADQDAPNGLIAIHESYAMDADGQINGVNSDMEYRAEGETDYTAINSNVLPGLTPGRYFIRYKAKRNYNASPDTEVVINAGEKRSVKIEITADLNKTYDGNSAEFTDGYIYYGNGNITFKWYEDVDGTRGNEISAPVNAGTYWIGVFAEGTERYNPASGYKQFTVSPEFISERDFTIDTAEKVYTGSEIRPAVKSANPLITENDFYVEYSDNINAGIAIVEVEGKNNFKGMVQYAFRITRADKTLSGENLSAVVNGYAEDSSGIITGVTPEMEYRKDGESFYTPVAGNQITGLENGTYSIRYAADENYNASAEVKIVINAPSCDCLCHSENEFIRFINNAFYAFCNFLGVNRHCCCENTHYDSYMWKPLTDILKNFF